MPESIPKLLINFRGKQQLGKAYIENPSPFSVFPHTFTPWISSQITMLACVKQQVLNQEGKELPQLLWVDNDLMLLFSAHFHDTRQVMESFLS